MSSENERPRYRKDLRNVEVIYRPPRRLVAPKAAGEALPPVVIPETTRVKTRPPVRVALRK